MVNREISNLPFVRLCTQAELPQAGSLQEFTVSGHQLCVANNNGAISAIDNICPHRQGPLAEGTLEDGKVLCPWHAWAFDLESGRADHDPSAVVEVYPVEVRGDEVFVAFK